MDAMGGRCEWTGHVRRAERLAIVWGGVTAQLLLWAIAFIVSNNVGPSIGEFSGQFLHTLLGWNLILVAVNLLPVKPLDGYEAWPLLWMIFQDWRRRRPNERKQQLRAKTIKKAKKAEEFKRLEINLTSSNEIREMIKQTIERAAAEHKAKNQA